MSKRKILCVAGTRPEVVKMAPVVRTLRAQPDRFEVVFMSTGQHRELLDQMFEVFDVYPDVDFKLMQPGQSLTQITCSVLTKLETYFRVPENRPDVVVAQGDTTTVMATSMAAFYARIPFAHIEAGLRTHDIHEPFPEEFNRKAAGVVTEYHFAPTSLSKSHLLAEGYPEKQIYITGNTVIDALQYILGNTVPPASPVPEGSKYIFMTCHRREIFGDKIREVFATMREFALAHPDLHIWYPVHPNPEVKGPAYELLGDLDHVHLTDPLDYVACLHAIAGCHLIVSDSGGVQEEAPSMGKPLLVLRDLTERQEGVSAGTCRLVGPHRENILAGLDELLNDPAAYEQMSRASNPYGDGLAADRIANILAGEAWEPWTA